jgi:hypothetical protein
MWSPRNRDRPLAFWQTKGAVPSHRPGVAIEAVPNDPVRHTERQSTSGSTPDECRDRTPEPLSTVPL